MDRTTRYAGSRGFPERLQPATGQTLALADIAICILTALAMLQSDGGGRGAAALITAGAVCGTMWMNGLYSRSFAVEPRDEAYHALAAVLFAALVYAPVLALAGSFTWLSIVLETIAIALLIGGARVMSATLRRPGPLSHPGELQSISARAWHSRQNAGETLLKRTFDVCVATIAVIVLSPVMAAAALAIAIDDGFPVLFAQQRVGLDGRTFAMLKFRTMCRNAGQHWAKPGDSRITRTGARLRRTSIDELPQLFNVIAGTMSLVGPRPEMADFAERFSHEMPNYAQRQVVRPGMTGWAQLYLNRNLEPRDVPHVLAYDLFYVEHATPLLDAALILKTAFELFWHRAV